jgi:hypothetical protein
MAHLYDVQTSNGGFDVTVAQHHEHMTKADFERILTQAIINIGPSIASGLILHHYTYKGPK